MGLWKYGLKSTILTLSLNVNGYSLYTFSNAHHCLQYLLIANFPFRSFFRLYPIKAEWRFSCDVIIYNSLLPINKKIYIFSFVYLCTFEPYITFWDFKIRVSSSSYQILYLYKSIIYIVFYFINTLGNVYSRFIKWSVETNINF